MKPKKVVVIGGGTGSYNLLRGLKRFAEKDSKTPIEVSAIVTMMDSGGSSGILRDEYGTLPPGDVRRCLVALSDETELMKSLFQYRFGGRRGSLREHNFGNLFLTTLTKILGSEEKAIKEAQKILKVRGKVIPVTLSHSHLCAVLENGDIVGSEGEIDLPRKNSDKKIVKVYLRPSAGANPEAVRAIGEADAIVLGPGDLYTSIIANLLVGGIAAKIRNSKALKIYNCNIMTKNGETNNFSVEDHFWEIEKYLGGGVIGVVTYNTKRASAKVLKNYEREKAGQVVFGGKIKGRAKPEFVGANLITEPKIIRHNPKKIAKLVIRIIFGS